LDGSAIASYKTVVFSVLLYFQYSRSKQVRTKLILMQFSKQLLIRKDALSWNWQMDFEETAA